MRDWGRIGSMFARGAVLLLRTCRPDSAARAAVAGLLLRARPSGGIHNRAQSSLQEEGGTRCDALAGVGTLEPYAGIDDAEEDDAIFDSAVRLLQRLQGPTCAATVRDLCDEDVREELHREHGAVNRQARSRRARALAACLVWFYHEERGTVGGEPVGGEPGLES